jgi:hypothetical protein
MKRSLGESNAAKEKKARVQPDQDEFFMDSSLQHFDMHSGGARNEWDDWSLAPPVNHAETATPKPTVNKFPPKPPQQPPQQNQQQPLQTQQFGAMQQMMFQQMMMQSGMTGMTPSNQAQAGAPGKPSGMGNAMNPFGASMMMMGNNSMMGNNPMMVSIWQIDKKTVL